MFHSPSWFGTLIAVEFSEMASVNTGVDLPLTRYLADAEDKALFHHGAAGTQETRAAVICDPFAFLEEADAYCGGVCRYRDHGDFSVDCSKARMSPLVQSDLISLFCPALRVTTRAWSQVM